MMFNTSFHIANGVICEKNVICPFYIHVKRLK